MRGSGSGENGNFPTQVKLGKMQKYKHRITFYVHST